MVPVAKLTIFLRECCLTTKAQPKIKKIYESVSGMALEQWMRRPRTSITIHCYRVTKLTHRTSEQPRIQ
jgi:hypothetical protein